MKGVSYTVETTVFQSMESEIPLRVDVNLLKTTTLPGEYEISKIIASKSVVFSAEELAGLTR